MGGLARGSEANGRREGRKEGREEGRNEEEGGVMEGGGGRE